MLKDFIPTLAGKVKLNVTQAKVGIKSCTYVLLGFVLYPGTMVANH